MLAEDGNLFSFGRGEYGVLGHGSCIHEQLPRQISKVASLQFSEIACGEYHSLALTVTGDIFSWGRGFEGQLGISSSVTLASTPTLLPSFQKFGKINEDIRKLIKNPVAKI